MIRTLKRKNQSRPEQQADRTEELPTRGIRADACLSDAHKYYNSGAANEASAECERVHIFVQANSEVVRKKIGPWVLFFSLVLWYLFN